ncbi:MAG TPA: hypothetical protein VFF77_03715 [Holophagaceae bacterium]|nr:hypothetical protein [Holophagaceae bacterium]
MKKTLVLLALASALPLAAQSFEVGALYTWNPTKTQSADPLGPSMPIDMKVDTWKAAGLRFGYNFMSVGPLEVQGNATVQFNNSEDFNWSDGSSSIKVGTVDYKYWAVGAAVNWNFLVRLGVGLEYRSESLSSKYSAFVPSQYNTSTTYRRPWIRATAGYVFPSPIVKPFIGIEAAIPVTSTSFSSSDLSGTNPNFDKLNKSLAPKAQYGIYAGIRF